MLRAAQVVVDEGLARPILIGRPEVIATRIEQLGLRLEPGSDFELRQLRTTRAIATYWTRVLPAARGARACSRDDARAQRCAAAAR